MAPFSQPRTEDLPGEEFHLTEADFESILQTTNSAVIFLAPDHRILRWNHGAERIFGFLSSEVLGKDFVQFCLPPDSRPGVVAEMQRVLAGHVCSHYENPVLTKDGEGRVLVWAASRLLSKDRQAVAVVAIGHDVTELKRAQALQAGENRVLALLAQGGSLEEALAVLAATVEEVCPAAQCAVLLTDKESNRLECAAAPHLPEELLAAIDGQTVGVSETCFALAAETGERAIAKDLDPDWDLPGTAAPRACWAYPITTADRRTLGSFCAFLSHPGEPTPFEHELMQTAARLAGVAAEQKRLERERIDQTEARFQTAVEELEALRQELRQRFSFEDLVAVSPAMLRVLQLAAQVAPTDATVLITGETGTGKEVLARAIHSNSPRAHGPFVAVNCGAIPETLVESELFGHERGAFTGADRRKPGRIERAAGGTLFLDEVGELPPPAQVKLLRMLQEKTFERLGGTGSLPADVRIIAATNRDLVAAMKENQFREDLYYRLNVFAIHIPPLRERREAIPELTARILRHIAARLSRPEIALSRPALEALLAYDWKGNIRELENALERAAILCGGSLIQPEHLPIHSAEPPDPVRTSGPRDILIHLEPGFRMDRLERRLLRQALELTEGNQTEAACLLGITRSALRWRVKKLLNKS